MLNPTVYSKHNRLSLGSLLMSSPSKMLSCVDSMSILRSPCNTSTAKTQWSFSKSPRFKSTKTIYCDRLYELPTTKTRRSTGFGIGKKTDLNFGKHPHQVTPSPDTYNIPDFAEQNKMHESGCKINIGRQMVAPMSYLQLQAMKVPGPGSYENINRTITPKWSFRTRFSTQLFPLTTSTTQKIVPGPGAHRLPAGIDPNGRYHLSKYKNSRSRVWDPKKSRRFGRSVTEGPGPGTYQPNNDLSNSGHYVLSQNQSHGQRVMLHSGRSCFVDEAAKHQSTSPGPGHYRLPSDFGQYDHKETCSNGHKHFTTLENDRPAIN